jgi:lactobin A/cerein 7B family class IIb bacteriocin
MTQVQSPAQGSATPSQVETSFVELDDEQLAVVSGGFTPTGGWGAELAALPVQGW